MFYRHYSMDKPVNLVLLSLLQIDWFVNPSLCLLHDDSGLCISSMQKRMLFGGFTAAKKTIIQNWFTPHMCGKIYWIHSLLQIVTYECTTAQINRAKPLTIDAWHCFLSDICLYKGVTFVFFLSFPLSLPFDWTLRYWVSVVLLYFGCYVWKIQNIDNKKKGMHGKYECTSGKLILSWLCKDSNLCYQNP